jgi:hypothetical protein
VTVTPFDYLESRDDADELIEEFGGAALVRILTNSGTAWEPSQTTADKATFAAVIDYDARQIDGENVLRTDRRALVAAGPLAALGVTLFGPTDKLVIGGDVYSLIDVKPIKPAAVVVMFDCQVRL